MNYLPLHVYSEYSFLSSSLKIDTLISICKENLFSMISISDDNLYAYPLFNKKCLENNIKPIFGIKINYQSHEETYPLYLYIKDEAGYQNLCQLIALNKNPSLDDLTLFHQGLILVIPCKENQYIYQNYNDENLLIKEIFPLYKIFKDIYLGIEIYSNEDQIIMNQIRDFAEKHVFDTICFPLHLYQNKKDALTLQLLNAIKEDKRLNLDLKCTGPYYFLNQKAANLLYTNKELENSIKLGKSTNFTFNKKRGKLLSYEIKEKMDKKEYIYSLCLHNLKNKVENFNNVYIERLNHELDIIEKMGYLDYFLIVQDYVNYAKNNHIPVGPGRGSAAGSLVAYGLNIIEVDPLKYNLIFERFLNPERISLPDIDMDFADNRIDDVIKYIGERFSFDRLAHIVTFQTIGAKQAIRDIGRIFSINQNDINHLASLIKNPGISLNKAKETNRELQELSKDRYFNKILTYASMIEGYPRQSGIHAAGIILNDEPLKYSLPLKINEDGTTICQYEASYLEELGYLKMDILALRNLNIIDKIVHKIDKDFSLKQIPLDDQSTLELFNKGYTLGIFQFEKEGITSTCKSINITSFDDLVACIALYRPGPLEYIPQYAENKKHPETIKYLHPLLEDILKPTYGVIIYQEQIMQIAQKISLFSLAEADLFRRAISKKDESKLMNLKEAFIQGALKNHLEENIANQIFESIVKFASYGFNKSHSVAYSMISYQMMYLKNHYPREFYSTLFDFISINDDIIKIKKELSYFSLELGLPNINISTENYVFQDKQIILPLSSIKSLGGNLISYIVEEREQFGKYQSYLDFLKRTEKFNLNITQLHALCDGGAFDEFKQTRATLKNNTSLLMQFVENINNLSLNEEEIKMLSPLIEEYEDDPYSKLENEFNAINVLISGTFLEKYQKQLDKAHVKKISSLKNNIDCKIGVIIHKVRIINTKKGLRMGLLQVSDDTSNVEVVIFPSILEIVENKLKEKNIIIVSGHLQINEKGISFIANEIELLEEKIS